MKPLGKILNISGAYPAPKDLNLVDPQRGERRMPPVKEGQSANDAAHHNHGPGSTGFSVIGSSLRVLSLELRAKGLGFEVKA